jgi:hypothetical protein
MAPFLSLHAIAAERGDGLHPELLTLFRSLAADASTTANAGLQEITPPSIAPRHLNETYLRFRAQQLSRRSISNESPNSWER